MFKATSIAEADKLAIQALARFDFSDGPRAVRRYRLNGAPEPAGKHVNMSAIQLNKPFSLDNAAFNYEEQR
ncbi:hypothetical protein FAZ95_14915 [Trinickia violacea]|uniref:Uncharacterized protein n=1 Tax=Trinickia violacea TaxID=2571746 RepID=A0A4P8IPX7_9BURK|nr:hypothetical protein [Trinickia violacea]QCP50346.1 hypothetical protein FAZ95_14915 [Trinickia violacea]